MAIDLGSVGASAGPFSMPYDWRDAVLYALAVGAGTSDLRYVLNEPPPKVLPTFGLLAAFDPALQVMQRSGADLAQLLHTGQRIEHLAPLPASGDLTTRAELRGIWDMKVGALCVVEAESSLGDQAVFRSRWDLLVRGAGGFGGERAPGRLKTRPPKDQAPCFEVEVPTRDEQALLYRLTGDINPIHAVPKVAQAAGFDRPILHGLCTYGIAARVALKELCGDDPARFVAFESRFSQVVLPGETLVVRGYDLGEDSAAITVEVAERGQLAIANARLDYRA